MLASLELIEALDGMVNPAGAQRVRAWLRDLVQQTPPERLSETLLAITEEGGTPAIQNSP